MELALGVGFQAIKVQQGALPLPLVSDSFNRADSTSTLGIAETGQMWMPIDSVWGIKNNEAYYVGGSGDTDHIAAIDVGTGNYTIKSIVTTPGDPVGIAFRVVGDYSYFIFAVADWATGLWKRDSGWTMLGDTGFRPVEWQPYELKVEVIDLNIKAYIDGLLILDYTLQGGDVSKFGSSVTKIGLYTSSNSSSSSLTTHNNFVVEGVY